MTTMIGIDIVEIERFEHLKRSDLASWGKVFSKKEWEYSFSKKYPAQHLAGIFAAKEAVMKAIGEDVMRRFDLIEIQHLKSGKPIAVCDTADKYTVEISISHNKNMAIAVAVSM